MVTIDQEKQDAMARAKCMYIENGNLTEAEAEELVGYEFVAGPATVECQIRWYFLKIKHNRPKAAAQILKEVEPLLSQGVRTEQEVHDLSVVLVRYIDGFVIYPELTQEMSDEMAQEFPRPLKTLTVMADKPYQVWHRKSQRVQWKAWRQGRPTVLGYGMTEQEAIDDLRYRVQPDHDGTLDGLGAPKGPTIDGNMFTSGELLKYNKGLFTEQR